MSVSILKYLLPNCHQIVIQLLQSSDWCIKKCVHQGCFCDIYWGEGGFSQLFSNNSIHWM